MRNRLRHSSGYLDIRGAQRSVATIRMSRHVIGRTWRSGTLQRGVERAIGGEDKSIRARARGPDSTGTHEIGRADGRRDRRDAIAVTRAHSGARRPQRRAAARAGANGEENEWCDA